MTVISYIVKSRVVIEDVVVGFMVKPFGKHILEYISVDSMVFGLTHKTISVKNVKLSEAGKPRGYNGFFLSKLPLESLYPIGDAQSKLQSLMKYLLSKMDKKGEHPTCERLGVVVSCTAFVRFEEYRLVDTDTSYMDLSSTLTFYMSHLPQEFANFYAQAVCVVNASGLAKITVSKKLTLSTEKDVRSC